MTIQEEIKNQINQALLELSLQTEEEITVEPASNATFGDYSSNIAMKLFPLVDKTTWNTPLSLAEAITEKLHSHPSSYVLPATTAKPGFINFTLSDEYFTVCIREILEEGIFVKYKRGDVAVVEYSSPNIAKPFTVGHLRSTIIGDAIANLMETVGYDVRRDNHLGDWGTQFGKLIVAIKELGEGKESSNVERISSSSQPVKELVKLYIEFHEKAENDPSLEEKAREWFTKLEHGDQEARELWQSCIDWSWQEFNRIYQELDIHFTENEGKGYGESFFEDKMTPVVEELEKSGYLQEGKEGAKLFFFPNDEYPPLMILKKDGSTLYATRDLATDRFRLEKYGKDVLVINEVGAEQELYFKQLYRIEELLGWYTREKRVHVGHGHFRFKEGKMSTRKGNVIWLEDVIEEAKVRAKQLSAQSSPRTADQVAIGAIKWNDLKRAARLDVTFDWDELLTMEGNSGPYLQYAAVRAKSILKKAEKAVESGEWRVESGHNEPANLRYQLNPQERSLARQLSYFEAAVLESANAYAPHRLCTYLYVLASTFNAFYNSNRILDDKEHKKQRVELTEAVYVVLEKGLKILGILVPEEM